MLTITDRTRTIGTCEALFDGRVQVTLYDLRGHVEETKVARSWMGAQRMITNHGKRLQRISPL